MNKLRSRPTTARLWPLCLCGMQLLLLSLGARQLAAQEQSVVEQLAPVLAAEDAREYQADLFGRALVAPDSLVRKVAALAAGRIGDYRATPGLVRLLSDPDSTVRVAAAFALGLLRDSTAVEPIIDRLTGQPALDAPTAAEAVGALAKIGGRRSGDFFAGVLGGRVVLSQEERKPAFNQVLADAWRLGDDAPVTALLPFMDDTSAGPRLRAVYSLGRLRAPQAGNRMLLVLRDQEPYIRSLAARALTRTYADSAGLAPSAVVGSPRRGRRTTEIPRSESTPSARSRATAIISSHPSSCRCSRIRCRTCRCRSPRRWASSAAARRSRVSRAWSAARVSSRFGGRRSWRSAAPIRPPSRRRRRAGARARTGATARRRRRAAALAGPGASPAFLADKDGRVIAAGLQAWAGEVEGPDPALLAAARPLLAHQDAAVRSVAPTSSPARRIRPTCPPLVADVPPHRPRFLPRCRDLGA